MNARTRHSYSTQKIHTAEFARTALAAVGLPGACKCSVVELSVDGGRWFAMFRVDAVEHARRQRAGCGALTATGPLHALWALPEDVPVPISSLGDREAATLLRAGEGYVDQLGGDLTRQYRAAGEIRAFAAVAALTHVAVRRVGQLPPIYSRVAVTTGAPLDEFDALGQARSLGLGVVGVDGVGGSTVQVQPAAPMLGVPGVYRWFVAELAYRNWLQANCAHCSN